MFAFILLSGACSGPSSTAPEAEPVSHQERRNPMEPIKIEVSQIEDRLIAGPRVGRGDTVLWIFTGNLVAQELVVRRKRDLEAEQTAAAEPDPSFIFHKPSGLDRVSGIPFPTDRDNDSFEYEIAVEGQEQPLPWAGGRNGGCVKPMWPQ
jgi:hypothetical protein